MNDLDPKTNETSESERPVTPRRRIWIHLLLYVIIFLSGGAVGIGTALIAVRSRAIHVLHHPEDMPERIAGEMRRTLSLNEEQTEEVERILRERQAAIREIRREFQPQVEAELDRIEEQVARILDEEQRAEWQEAFRSYRRDWVPAVPDP